MTSNHRVIFMGSPDFAVPILKSLAMNYQLVGVVTQPDRPAGRGKKLSPPPVKLAALEFGLPVIQPEKLKEPGIFETLENWRPDVIVVAAFGQILRQNVLGLPEFGCINVHASLLPRWRGAAPVQAAILHGDSVSGVTIMKMDAGIDTGAILAQSPCPLAPQETALSLSEKLSVMGADLLIKILPDYLSGKLSPVPQDESRATYAGLIKKEMGLLDFQKPAAELERQVRAFLPWPGSTFFLEDQPCKVMRASVVQSDHGRAPGTFTILNGFPAVYCGEDCLVLEEIQPSGKKPMNGKDFLRGYTRWV